MADPVNPYLPDKGQQLAALLMSLGQGFTAADASGRSPWAGLSYGAGLYGQAQHQANEEAQKAYQWKQTYDQTEAYRKAQEEALKAQTEQRNQELGITKDLIAGMGGIGGLTGTTGSGSVPGMGVPTQPPMMGPSPNNIGNVRPVGGGPNSGFQQPASFDDGVALSVKNARAYPAAFNQGQPMTLMQIGERWAPKGDGGNDPKAWAFNVARFSGLDPNQPLDLNDPQQAAAFARGVHGAEKGAGGIRPVADYQPGVQLAQSGNPQILNRPQGQSMSPTNVQPPRLDPMRGLPFTLSKTLAPFGQAMISAGNSETDRYLRDLDRVQRDEQFGRTQGNVERNAKVGPDNRPNMPVIDAETEAARRKAEAESGVKLENEAALKLAADEMARYSKDVRPGVESTANGLPNLYAMKRLADSPIAAGPFLDTRQFSSRVADWLGVSNLSDPMVSRTEFANRAAKNVLAILQTRALGSGNAISEGDRKFVEKMAASGGDFTQQELQKLVQIGIDNSHLAIKQHGDVVGRLAKLPGVGKIDKGYFDIAAPSYDEWAKANPPTAAAAPAASSLEEEMKRRGLLGRTPAPASNPLNDEMRRRGLR